MKPRQQWKRKVSFTVSSQPAICTLFRSVGADGARGGAGESSGTAAVDSAARCSASTAAHSLRLCAVDTPTLLHKRPSSCARYDASTTYFHQLARDCWKVLRNNHYCRARRSRISGLWGAATVTQTGRQSPVRRNQAHTLECPAVLAIRVAPLAEGTERPFQPAEALSRPSRCWGPGRASRQSTEQPLCSLRHRQQGAG